MTHIEKYRSESEIHSSIDYENTKSVKRGNQAADTLRKLAKDELSLDDLLSILVSDHSSSSFWAAHHLLEFYDLTVQQYRLAIQRIETEITKGGASAFGERMFLDEIRKKRDHESQ